MSENKSTSKNKIGWGWPEVGQDYAQGTKFLNPTQAVNKVKCVFWVLHS